MLELTTKWMTNTLAKKSIQTNDFIKCANESKLYILSYGEITSSGKNTYNYRFIDSEGKEGEGSNAYLDALTKLILSSNPKAKANKESETNENKPKEAKKQTKNANECLYLTFDEAFQKACNMIESYKEIAIMLGKYDAKDAIKLTLNLINDAKRSEEQRIKDEKKRINIEALQRTLAIAIESQNNAMIEQIKQMIIIEESL